jgi:hypothetical protein
MGPAVLRFDHADESASLAWQPFVEDLRTSAATLVHPECFAQEHGLRPLLDLITASEREHREDASQMRQRIASLRGEATP